MLHAPSECRELITGVAQDGYPDFGFFVVTRGYENLERDLKRGIAGHRGYQGITSTAISFSELWESKRPTDIAHYEDGTSLVQGYMFMFLNQGSKFHTC